MAVNKRKVLDNARKFAQKGAKEKALKEYNSLLKLDPRDAKLLLEVGDAYRRWGQNEEAVAQYTRVAEQYKQDGFDARAVAVYKQILNLDPKRYVSHVALSELYQRMGLDAEAVHALQTAADGYNKEGQKREALELLRRMATLDPTNTTSRMKVADLLRQEGMTDDAVAEYEAVAAELQRQGASEAVLGVHERILEVDPDRVDMLVAVARGLLAQSEPERAEPFARRAFEAEPDGADHFDVLSGIYKALAKDEELAGITRDLAKVYRDRGDEDRARELIQRLPVTGSLDLTGEDEEPAGQVAAEAPDDDDEVLLGDEDRLLGDDDLLDDDFLAEDKAPAQENLSGDSQDEELDLGTPLDDEDVVAESGDEPLPDGDPDQLFAEASVYLRYGKHDQAIASLRATVAQQPEHRAAWEKLGECYAERDESERAVEAWTHAAQQAQEEGDGAAFEVLCERIGVLDPTASAELSQEAGSLVGAPDPESVDAADEIDLDLDDEVSIEIDVDDEDPGDEDFADLGQVEDSMEVEIDIAAVEQELDLSDIDTTEAAPGSGEDASSGGGSTTTSQQIAEDLEEAEFYFQQSLFDEAEAIYQRILEVAPNHPSAMLRMGELAVARGDDPGASMSDDAMDADGESTLGVEFGEKAMVDDDVPAPTAAEGDEVEFEIDVDVDVDDDVAVELEEGPEASSATNHVAEGPGGVDDRTEVALPDSSPDLDEPQSPIPPEPVAVADPMAELVASESVPTMELDFDSQAEAPAAPRPATAEVTVPLMSDEDTFDLAAELRDSLDAEEVHEEESPADSSASSGVSTVADGFDTIFSDFKAGVSETLSDDDHETRFDLGIAYREMELFEDAIGEFRICLENSDRRLESLHMLGLCALDLDRFEDAVNHLQQALAMPDLPVEKEAGLYFDLGRAAEGLGDGARARDAYQNARNADASFPGVDDRIAAAEQLMDEPGAVPELQSERAEDGLESFDDLVAEVSAEEEPAESEQLESFDDLISEVAEVPESESKSENPSVPGEKGTRKKKISFV
ncbi:MAG: tetratricopeptide repeat protein [Deltaproteobacteria bacterium]|nr:tetratricopeptide repeat protein [Deltaproteobacteria bacterium]